MSNNYFQGAINAAICTISNHLHVFKMSSKFFSGEIPKNLGDCSSLQLLSMSGNVSLGSLPESIFQLQNLRVLYLQDNKLSEPLSKVVGKLSNLLELDISNNGFLDFFLISLGASQGLWFSLLSQINSLVRGQKQW